MVLVFDKKTPENAFNSTKSNRVVGEQIFLASIKNIPVQVLLTVAAQTIFLNDFKLKSVQVDHSHTVSVPQDGPSLCNIYFISILHNICIFNYDFVAKILLDMQLRIWRNLFCGACLHQSKHLKGHSPSETKSSGLVISRRSHVERIK